MGNASVVARVGDESAQERFDILKRVLVLPHAFVGFAAQRLYAVVDALTPS
jgi:hypothetical protein